MDERVPAEAYSDLPVSGMGGRFGLLPAVSPCVRCPRMLPYDAKV